MKVEKSAGALVFRETGGQRLYLLLSRPRQSQSGDEKKGRGDVWDFPKGNIEQGEKPLEAAKREVREETGIEDLEYIEGFKKTIRIFYQWAPKPGAGVAAEGLAKGEKRLKFITFFLAKTSSEQVKISFEHNTYAWLLPGKALEQLSFKNSKEIMREAEEFLRARV